MTTLIIGGGEIGSALADVFEKAKYKVAVLDMDKSKCRNAYDNMGTCGAERLIVKNVEFMHICYGHFKYFDSSVIDYIKLFSPKVVVINSTVPVGTTSRIRAHGMLWTATDKAPVFTGPVITNSPVRGRHHDLVNQLHLYTKFVGAANRKDGSRVAEHFWRAGIPSMYIGQPEVTEMGKLLDTSYYGIILATHQEFYRLCKEAGVDFIKTFNLWNDSANEGFKKIGTENLYKPTLSPGNIGGHCILPNLKLLKLIPKNRKSKLIDFIENSNKMWGEEK